jgi:hypothetical protein
MKPQAGRCPCCGSLGELDYEGPDHDGYCMYYSWVCRVCDSTGTEEYTVAFNTMAVKYHGDKNKFATPDR